MEEFQMRYQLFCENLKKIDELNKAPGQTATFGVTHFTDRTGLFHYRPTVYRSLYTISSPYECMMYRRCTLIHCVKY